jgi:hypothetical protein
VHGAEVHDSTMPPPLVPVPEDLHLTSAHWLQVLYERMDAGDVEALRAVATPQYHLRIPELGVDIAGLDAVVAWLEVRGTEGHHRLQSVAEHRSFVVATLVLEGEDGTEPIEHCHVYTRTDEGLAACCVVSGALIG